MLVFGQQRPAIGGILDRAACLHLTLLDRAKVELADLAVRQELHAFKRPRRDHAARRAVIAGVIAHDLSWLAVRRGPVRVRHQAIARTIPVAAERRIDSPPLEIGTAEQDMTARSEEHTSELQSPMCISYAVFFLHKK